MVNVNKQWFEMFIALIGALMIAASFLIDLVGLGERTGFGLEQIILAICGGTLVLAATAMLTARPRGWYEPEIPTLAELRAFAYAQRQDILLVVILMSTVGFASYQGAQFINPAYYECDYEATWFHGDITYVFHKMSDPVGTGYDNSHPFFPLVTYPPVKVLERVFGLELIMAVRMVVAAVAAFWISAIFIILRLIGCRRFGATLFSVLAITSASAMIWLVVPETFPLGSLSILLALGLVAVAEHRKLSPLWYTVVSTLTLSFTITNWMAGLLATIVKHPWKRSLQITVNALFLALLLWEIQLPFLFNLSVSTPFLYILTRSGEEQFTPESGGPLQVGKSFIFHTMVIPAFEVADENSGLVGWPMMYTQPSPPGSGSLWGTLAVVLWIALLGLGLWALFSIGRHRPFRIVLGLTLLGQLALHILFGEETFLYSIHFAPLLVILAALSMLTRMRHVALGLAGALVLSVGINNGLQFMRAIELVQCMTHWPH